MNKKIWIRICLCCSIFGMYCQYQVKITELPDPQQYLVINASITPDYGTVSVSYSLTQLTPLGGYIFPLPPTSSAYVTDSHGNNYYFNTDGRIDATFKGQIGETYQLFVEADGQQYISEKETMRECPKIDSLTATFYPESFRSPEDDLYYGFDVYANFTDVANTENFYQWDWVHYQRTESCGLERIGEQNYKVPCTPYDCWGIYENNKVIVQSDRLRDGVAIAHKVHRVPFVTPSPRYYLKVEQRAISPRVFEYLKSQEVQNQNTGSIFDIPAQTRFSPNISNQNNPDEDILGAFNVFSSKSKIIIIDRTQVINGIRAKAQPNLLPWHPDPLKQADCVESATRTQKRPEGWVD